MIAKFTGKPHRPWLAILATLLLAVVCLTDAAVGQQRRGGNQPNPGAGGGRNPIFEGGGAGMPVLAARLAPDGVDKGAEAANAQTRAALARKVPEVRFDNVPLVEVVAFLQDLTSLNFYVDWKAMEAAGIDKNVAVSLRLKDVPASEVLRLILRETSPFMHYNIESGIVVISPTPAQPLATIRAYKVDDLTSDKAMELQRTSLEALLRNQTDDAKRDEIRNQLANMLTVIDQNRVPKIQQLVQLLQTAVAPYTNSMTVQSFESKLIITADDAGHQEVSKVLQMLREESAPEENRTERTKPVKPATAP